ncbi:MAG TPA: hypothetical protein VFK76_11610 [Gaiellaceae bacterium]|nr:hypothetical protein [Gaiellaceae bacterium]
MKVVGVVAGAVVGFVLGIILEVTFANDKGGWADVVPFALAVLGALVGSSLARRRSARRAMPS